MVFYFPNITKSLLSLHYSTVDTSHRKNKLYCAGKPEIHSTCGKSWDQSHSIGGMDSWLSLFSLLLRVVHVLSFLAWRLLSTNSSGRLLQGPSSSELPWLLCRILVHCINRIDKTLGMVKSQIFHDKELVLFSEPLWSPHQIAHTSLQSSICKARHIERSGCKNYSFTLRPYSHRPSAIRISSFLGFYPLVHSSRSKVDKKGDTILLTLYSNSPFHTLFPSLNSLHTLRYAACHLLPTPIASTSFSFILFPWL